jgi:mRNA interferase MazF
VGDIIKLDFDPQAGREQAGWRAALVLTPRRYNELTGLCVVCPITNTARGWNFEVAIANGRPVPGVVLSDHVKSLSWEARRATLVCAAPNGVLVEVKAKIKALVRL